MDIEIHVCPVLFCDRDEEGFLSEWTAFYQMHGFDHIIFFNDNSVDNSISELKPWIDSGFVSIVGNWTLEELNINPAFTRN